MMWWLFVCWWGGVEPGDVLDDRELQFAAGLLDAIVDQLGLERIDEALSEGVDAPAGLTSVRSRTSLPSRSHTVDRVSLAQERRSEAEAPSTFAAENAIVWRRRATRIGRKRRVASERCRLGPRSPPVAGQPCRESPSTAVNLASPLPLADRPLAAFGTCRGR